MLATMRYNLLLLFLWPLYPSILIASNTQKHSPFWVEHWLNFYCVWISIGAIIILIGFAFYKKIKIPFKTLYGLSLAIGTAPTLLIAGAPFVDVVFFMTFIVNFILIFGMMIFHAHKKNYRQENK